MGALSDADAANLLNAKFNGAALSVPAHYFVALSTTQPNDDGTGVTEPSGAAAAGYGRVSVTPNTTNFPTTTTRTISTGVDINIPDPVAGDDWGVITHFALYDALTVGVFRGWGAFGDGLHILAGVTGNKIPAGALVIVAPGS